MRLILALLLCAAAYSQTAQWPTSAAGASDIPRAADGSISALYPSGINSSATSFTVADASAFRQYQMIRVDSEKMLITGISGDTLTVTRGYDSTTAASHSNGALVRGEFYSYGYNKIRLEMIAMQATLLPIGTALTTRGDLMYRGASGVTRLALGTSGYCLTSNGTDAVWASCPSGFSDPMTTRGDVIVRGSSGTARLALGTSGYCLKSDGTDVVWGSCAGAGGLDTLGPSGGLYFFAPGVPDIDTTIICRKGDVCNPTGMQDHSAATGWNPPEKTVATLPTASSYGDKVFMVTDGVSVTDCVTGGGSTRAWCVSNGAAWVTLGASGSGSGANADGYYLVSRTLNAPTNAVNLGALSSGVLKVAVSGGVATPGIVTGTATDCVLVDGSSVPCGTGGGSSGVGRTSSAVNFSSAIPDGGCADQTFTWSGVTTADTIIPGWPAALNAGLVGSMRVSASNTVSVRLCNLSGAAVTPGSLTYAATLAVYNLSGSTTINFSPIADGACATSTWTLTGAAAGDPVTAGWPTGLETGLLGIMRASATDTVEVRLCNLSGASVDPASATFKASIAK